LYISIRGDGEINLPELLHDELEHGLTGVMCSLTVDPLTLLMVQDHGWFATIRPEHTYDENKDSREFITCLPFEKLLLATGNEVNAPKLSRGHFNHPGYLRQTFAELQKLFDKKPEILRGQTNAAWRYLFLGEPLPKEQ
jgi:Tat protein secretion system quality control protein TatD with DNase activity